MWRKGEVTQKQQEVHQTVTGRLQRRKPKNEKHEMEVEIEKVVKAQKEAQSAAEVTERNKLHTTKKAG